MAPSIVVCARRSAEDSGSVETGTRTEGLVTSGAASPAAGTPVAMAEERAAGVLQAGETPQTLYGEGEFSKGNHACWTMAGSGRRGRCLDCGCLCLVPTVAVMAVQCAPIAGLFRNLEIETTVGVNQ